MENSSRTCNNNNIFAFFQIHSRLSKLCSAFTFQLRHTVRTACCYFSPCLLCAVLMIIIIMEVVSGVYFRSNFLYFIFRFFGSRTFSRSTSFSLPHSLAFASFVCSFRWVCVYLSCDHSLVFMEFIIRNLFEPLLHLPLLRWL